MTGSAQIGCLYPGCGRVAYYRGLCSRHLSRLTKRIKDGELAWAEAERQGLCLPAKGGWKTRRET